MLPEKFADVLWNVICRRLKGKDIEWALFGSAELAFRGIDIVPNDIDIVTATEADALAIDELLAEYRLQKPIWSEAENVRSYFGHYIVDGVKVDIAGAMEYKADGKWEPIADITAEYKSNKLRFIHKHEYWIHDLCLPNISSSSYYEAIGREDLVNKMISQGELLNEGWILEFPAEDLGESWSGFWRDMDYERRKDAYYEDLDKEELARIYAAKGSLSVQKN